MRSISEIIVHCSATPEGQDFTTRDITRWHRARKYRTIGYHYVIYRDGSIHEGRPLEAVGAHCAGHNSASIGICYIGGCAADGKTPKDTRTPEQKRALRALIKELKARFPKATIHGHREFAAKACPCFDAFSEYRNLAIAALVALALASCHTSKSISEEKTGNEELTSVSHTATTVSDKFLHNIVIQIDSIVATQLPEPIVVTATDEGYAHHARAEGIGNGQAATPLRICRQQRPQTTKVVISGISLHSNIADSSHVESVTTHNSRRQANHSSQLQAKEVTKPPNSPCHLTLITLLLLVLLTLFAVGKNKM
jgi:N-acetylmuramoyl-L-alanine amidase